MCVIICAVVSAAFWLLLSKSGHCLRVCLVQVNRTREVGAPGYESQVVTHTDGKELFVWNIETQPARHPPVCHLLAANALQGRHCHANAGL